MPKIGTMLPQPNRSDNIRRFKCPKCGMYQSPGDRCRGNDCDYVGKLPKEDK